MASDDRNKTRRESQKTFPRMKESAAAVSSGLIGRAGSSYSNTWRPTAAGPDNSVRRQQSLELCSFHSVPARLLFGSERGRVYYSYIIRSVSSLFVLIRPAAVSFSCLVAPSEQRRLTFFPGKRCLLQTRFDLWPSSSSCPVRITPGNHGTRVCSSPVFIIFKKGWILIFFRNLFTFGFFYCWHFLFSCAWHFFFVGGYIVDAFTLRDPKNAHFAWCASERYCPWIHHNHFLSESETNLLPSVKRYNSQSPCYLAGHTRSLIE